MGDIEHQGDAGCRPGEVAELAARQHGYITRDQLVALGIRRGAIGRDLINHRLIPKYPGVYAVGYVNNSTEGECMAATLACGPGSAVSHRAAAYFWGLFDSINRIEVSVPRSRRWSRESSLVVHRPRSLPGTQISDLRGIPVTTVSRTLSDLAMVVSPRILRRAVHEADVMRLLDRSDLFALIESSPRRRGAQLLRAMAAVERTVTRSELERRFLGVIDRAGIPRPRMNHLISVGERRFELDAVWTGQRLVVELDGFAAHGTRHSFESDRERDRLLTVGGFRVIRVTWRQLQSQPERITEDLRAALNLSGGRHRTSQ